MVSAFAPCTQMFEPKINFRAPKAQLDDTSDDQNTTLRDFSEEILIGLLQPQKMVSSRFFYDSRGSALFDQITDLPEYYPTRIETALLDTYGDDIAQLTGKNRPIIEFGAGSLRKTPLLLKATAAQTYIPIDISGAYLRNAASALSLIFPQMEIIAIEGDFTKNLRLPHLDGPLIGFFPGSTIGNFDPTAARVLLRSFRRILGNNAQLIIGIDTRKNIRILEAAYNDRSGITAEFNLNILRRINRELDGTIPTDAFVHRALWNEGLGRIEMHLMAVRDVQFYVLGRAIAIGAGETIHTENSYKYSHDETNSLARASGWNPKAFWCDAEQLFGLHVWHAAP